MRYRVWLKAEAPLVITVNRAAGNQLETLQWIPGTTWRGALAQSVIAGLKAGAEPHRDADFRTLFLDGRVRFGCLTANGERPFPRSARICADHDDHPVRDLLLRRELGTPLPRTCDAPLAGGCTCKAKLTPYEGLVRIEERRLLRRDPPVRVTAHTAIASATLRTRDEQFYTATAIERGTSFQGDVWVQDEAAGNVFEKVCTASTWLALGRGRTRGQGMVSLQFEKQTAANITRTEELQALNRSFLASGRLVFAVTLDSPCLVFDQWGLPRPYLASKDIAEAAGLPPGDLADYTLADWFSRSTIISGWNAQAGLPKSDMLAISPGSAFLFQRTWAEGGDRQQEYERLAAVFAKAAAGIGERWAEGYGGAHFCDGIHCEETPS